MVPSFKKMPKRSSQSRFLFNQIHHPLPYKLPIRQAAKKRQNISLKILIFAPFPCVLPRFKI